jgi:ribonucleotide monophosphatase NagD (HAD superfamily)
LFFSWDEDASVLDDCELTVSKIQDASFILCCGVSRRDLSHYTNDLKLAYQRNLELVVSNPDLVAMNPDGSLKICPGTNAKSLSRDGREGTLARETTERYLLDVR